MTRPAVNGDDPHSDEFLAAKAAFEESVPPLTADILTLPVKSNGQAQREEEQEQKLPRKPVNWARVFVDAPPERQWAIPGWLGRGHVTLLAGPPGSGKTALVQTIISSLALGREAIEQPDKPLRGLLWAGEDDQPELERRAIAIAAHLGAHILDFDQKVFLMPYQDVDITLCAQTGHGGFCRTALMDELEEQIGDYKADVVFLDSIARLFGGNENDRHHVTQFIAWLNAALKPTNAAICILGHPSKTAGAEWSGSTAWEASVRTRWYFGATLPDAENADSAIETDSNYRWLCKRKTNYSSKDKRHVKWEDGCMQIMPAEGLGKLPKKLGPDFLMGEAVRIFRRLREMGLEPAYGSKSSNWLPGLAEEHGMLDGLTKADIRAGLSNALKAGKLKVAEIGKYQNRTAKVGLIEP